MTVFEHMIIEASAGAERELTKRIVLNLKSEFDLIPVCGSEVLRKAFLKVYRLYPRIEDLPDEEKKELKQWVIKHFPGRPVNELIENCKIVYTAGKLTDLQKIEQ